MEGGLRVAVLPTARPLTPQHVPRGPPSGLGIAPMPLRTIYFYGSRIIHFPGARFMGQKYLPSGIRDTATVVLTASAPHVGCRRLHDPSDTEGRCFLQTQPLGATHHLSTPSSYRDADFMPLIRLTEELGLKAPPPARQMEITRTSPLPRFQGSWARRGGGGAYG